MSITIDFSNVDLSTLFHADLKGKKKYVYFFKNIYEPMKVGCVIHTRF